MAEDKRKESSGGKHLSGKSSGLSSIIKPAKKPPAKKKYQGHAANDSGKPEKTAAVSSALDEDFPMAGEDRTKQPAETVKKPVNYRKTTGKAATHHKTLLERTWFKVIIAVFTVAVVFGICILISNIFSANENNAEIPQETSAVSDTPAPSVAPAQETDSGPVVMSKNATPTPAPTALPSESPSAASPSPAEEPTPSPAPTDSADLTADNLVTPAILPETEGCEQLLLLDSTGSTGSLMYYEKDSGGWHLIMTSGATLGKNGVSNNKKEGDNTTPSGEYPLLFVYGETKPITQMPFQKLTSDSVWVDDSRSKYYNTLQSTGNPDKDWSSSEAVYERYFKGGTHKACIYVGYNGDGLTSGTATPGKGSMITICGKTDSLTPTAGCIDIFNTDMTKLLQYLDPNRNPVIIID